MKYNDAIRPGELFLELSPEEFSKIEMDTDELLMRRFQTGEAEAFGELFNRYAAHLINFAYRSLQSKEEAEDIAQEVLWRVHQKKDRFDAKRPFRPWMFSIAVRLISNQLRYRKRHPKVSLDMSAADDESQKVEALNISDKSLLPVEEELEKKKLAEVVWEALDVLPETQRSAVLLARFEELSYEEIAMALNTSVAAVRSLLLRARQSLKNYLEPYVIDPEKTERN